MKYRNKETGEIVEKRWVFWPFIGITRKWAVPVSELAEVRYSQDTVVFHTQYEPCEEPIKEIANE